MFYFLLKSFNLIKWRNNDVITQYSDVWFSLGHKRFYAFKDSNRPIEFWLVSTFVAPCKVIQDSLEFWIPDSRYWIPDFLPVELGFQSLAGYLIPWAKFRILKPRISDSTSKNSPDSRIRFT